MVNQEHHPHMLYLPRFFDIIKYIQLVISVLLIGPSAFCIYVLALSAHAYAIFVSLYTSAIIIYYLVASKATTKNYNWIALLVLEVLAVVFWLATWAVLGALFAALAYIGSYYDDYYSYYKRDLETRDAYSYGLGYAGCLIAAIALAVINFLLYVLTLVYMSRAVHQHRKSGMPVRAGESSRAAPGYANEYPSTNGGAADYEKGNAVPMQPMGTNQEYYSTPAPPYPQQHQNKAQMPAEPYMDPSRVQSPVSTGAPSEVGIGNRGEMHEAPSQRY